MDVNLTEGNVKQFYDSNQNICYQALIALSKHPTFGLRTWALFSAYLSTYLSIYACVYYSIYISISS